MTIKKEDTAVLAQYLNDLKGVFLKKFSDFTLSAQTDVHADLSLQTILMEMIKIKRLINNAE